MSRTYDAVVTVSASVRVATLDDLDRLQALREEVAVDLLQRGIPWNPHATSRQKLEEWVGQSTIWVATSGDELAGMVAVWWADPTGYWPKADLGVYVHDLLVSPARKGQGVGALLLRWVESFAEGRGRKLVRLDCEAANLRLCRYYQDLGYSQVGEHAGSALFEKRFSSRDGRI